MEVISVRKKNLQKLGYQDFEDWAKDPNHLYIGRNMNFYVKGALKSKWANPFSVKKYGRDESLRLYREYILNRQKNNLIDDLEELCGKTLGCWCREPGTDPNTTVCHGDILKELVIKTASR